MFPPTYFRKGHTHFYILIFLEKVKVTFAILLLHLLLHVTIFTISIKKSKNYLQKIIFIVLYTSSKDCWGLSSSGRAPALQAGGGGFDPRRLHHYCVILL